jgi:hypothetical protein
MGNFNGSMLAISTTLNDYFDGIFNGDVDALRGIFHPQALVSGDIKGQPYLKTLDEYLAGVKNRRSPQSLGEAFRMRIIGIEVLNSTAIAKVQVSIFEYNYYDLLSLTLVNGRWIIMNKLLTHVN